MLTLDVSCLLGEFPGGLDRGISESIVDHNHGPTPRIRPASSGLCGCISSLNADLGCVCLLGEVPSGLDRGISESIVDHNHGPTPRIRPASSGLCGCISSLNADLGCVCLLGEVPSGLVRGISESIVDHNHGPTPRIRPASSGLGGCISSLNADLGCVRRLLCEVPAGLDRGISESIVDHNHGPTPRIRPAASGLGGCISGLNADLGCVCLLGEVPSGLDRGISESIVDHNHGPTPRMRSASSGLGGCICGLHAGPYDIGLMSDLSESGSSYYFHVLDNCCIFCFHHCPLLMFYDPHVADDENNMNSRHVYGYFMDNGPQ
uniref:Uncharacterized protein LOC116942049 n=1 Tax=Petromyzon marinus TaxID=7757 RepID=A0AAJ7T1D2_PETMA|nr:uncharacterized protein LOC116942049 [Petromyzon marinus]